MPVPAQVQAQADKADAMLKELSEKEKAPAAVVTNPEDQGKDKPAEETVESLKHKLAVLQGKYNSEIQALKDDVNLLNNLKNQVRTLNGQISDSNGKLNEANRLIGELQKQITERPAAPADDGKAVLSSLDEEDLDYLRGEGFDDKAIGILLKALSKKDQAKPAQNQDEIAEIRKELETKKVK